MSSRSGDSGEGIVGSERAINQENEAERNERIRNLFDSFDTSKTGYLDHKEIEAGLHKRSIPFQKKYALELLTVCDANHDGRIDFPEFQRYMDAKELELYKLFQSIDVSRDGALEPEELRVALESSGFYSSFLSTSCSLQLPNRCTCMKVCFLCRRM